MDWTTRVRAAFEAGRAPDDDVIEELAQHAADLYETARAEGDGEQAAIRSTEAQIAAWAIQAPALRRPRRGRPAPPPPPAPTSQAAGLLLDIRYGVRLLRRQPVHTAAAVLTLALGIGATTVICSVLYGVLLKPLPWQGADRLVRVSEVRKGGSSRLGPILTNATYRAWRDAPSTIEGLAGWSVGPWTLTDGKASDRIEVASVTASVFPLLGGRAELGTLFGAADEEPGAAPALVISHGLWLERFGGSRSVVGRAVRLDGRDHRVVAVMAPGFSFPSRETRAWVPFFVPPVSDGKTPAKTLSIFSGLARLRPGVTPAQAAAEGTARARHAEDAGLTAVAVFGSNAAVGVSVVPLLEAQTAEVRPALLVFLAAVVLLLATATANVASLQLARAAGRRREMAVRAALGGGAGRLARQLLVESTLLGLAGGAAGVALAAALGRALPVLLPADFPRLAEIGLGFPVLLVSLGVSIASGLVFGLAPAVHLRRLSLVESLADGAAPVGAGMRSRTARARAAVMVVQVACACVLLLGAALLGRSFQSLLRADRGFDPRNVLTASLPMPDSIYTGPRRAAFAEELLQRLSAMPGVRSAAITATLPLMRGELLGGFVMPSRDGTGTRSVRAAIRQVSPGYFTALGVRIVAGRGFRSSDTSASQPVVLVNRAFVKQYLDEPAIGQRLPSGEIVGVVDDVRQRAATDATQPEVYRAWAQADGGIETDEPRIVVRTAGDPRPLVATLRSLVRSLDANLALDDVRTMEDRVGANLARPRLYAVLLGGFAAFALAIAAIGLFGVLSYIVAQRTREIGVRAALGASPGRIVAIVLKQGLVISAAGALLGLGLSFVLVKYLSTLLYGVRPYDPWSYALVALIVLAASAGACAVPARRAARTDPLRALRQS